MCQNETASGEAWDCWTASVTEMERAKLRGRNGGRSGEKGEDRRGERSRGGRYSWLNVVYVQQLLSQAL